jgi:PKHD-type hydroxylase
MVKLKKQTIKKNKNKIKDTNIQQSSPIIIPSVSTPSVEPQVKITANNQFCSILHTSFFDEKQCNAILTSLVEELWKKGETENTSTKDNKNLRQVEEQIMPTSSNGWPLTRILEFANQANNARFKFDLSGFLDIDAPMIMRYKKGHYYDWHIDIGPESINHRKISCSVQLSDPNKYEGGDFEIWAGGDFQKVERKQGCAILFPSFLMHRVTPITKGTRKSLVLWMGGDSYK